MSPGSFSTGSTPAMPIWSRPTPPNRPVSTTGEARVLRSVRHCPEHEDHDGGQEQHMQDHVGEVRARVSASGGQQPRVHHGSGPVVGDAVTSTSKSSGGTTL